MGVIQQLGQFSGEPYSFTIAGDTPTPEEANRISQILEQQEAPFRRAFEQQYGGLRSLAREEATEPDRSLSSAFKFALDQPLENIAETARSLGYEGTGDFFSDLVEAPENYESAAGKFMNPDGFGFDFRYMPRALAEQAGQFVGSMAARGVGVVGGGLVGGAPGALIGGFAGPAIFEAIQLLGPIANERARNNGREVPNAEDWLGSIAGSSASGAVNAIAPGMSGFLRRTIVETGTEGLQALIQQTGETALTDKGLDLSFKEALGEGLLGGGAAAVVGAPIDIATNKRLTSKSIREREAQKEKDKKEQERLKKEAEKDEQLIADLKEFTTDTRERLGYASVISQELTTEAEKQNDQAIAAEQPPVKEQRPIDPLAVAEVTTDEEFKNKTFTKAQYDRVLQQVKSDTAREKALNISAIQQQVSKDVGKTTVPQVRGIMNELSRRGYVNRVGQRFTPTTNIQPQLKTPDVSYRRQIDIASEATEKNNNIIKDLKLDLDSVRQYGRDLQGRRTSEKAIQYEIDRLNERNKQYSTVINESQSALNRLGNLPYVPKVTPEFNKAQKLETKIAAAKARKIADSVQEKVQLNKPVYTPALTQKQEKVFKDIRKRLNKYGLKDVKLSAEQLVRDEEGEGIEGSFEYNPTNRMISLSMGVYDPKLSEKQLFERVGEVLDHETTHALKNMNVIKDKEWQTLASAAAKAKYVKSKKGKPELRKYTYLDRAKKMYADQSPEIQIEEAVAEMFRDYNAGRLKITGKPRTILDKIKNFFKSIIGGNLENGFTDAATIFDDINLGEIGSRERAPLPEESIKVDKDADAVETPAKASPLPRSASVPSLQGFIKDNPDGFTVDPITLEPVSGGFVVAPLKQAEIIVGETLPEEVLLGYIEDNKDISRAINRPVYLGGWFDGESKQYFLDNTLIVPTAEEALYIAEAADQLAIFNLNNFEEIRTNEGIEGLKQSGAYRSDAAIGYQRNLAEVGRRFEEARNKRNAIEREQLTKIIKAIPLTTRQIESLPRDLRLIFSRNNPDVFKQILMDDELGADIIGELRNPNIPVADAASQADLNSARQQIYNLTQKALERLPNRVTVYRYGKLNEADGMSSFTLNPEFKNLWRYLPQATPRQKELATNNIDTYTVDKSDILAAVDLAQDFGEQEVIIRNDAVKRSGTRQSRLTLDLTLTPEQRAASILDYLDPNTGEPKFRSKEGSETLVSFANKLLQFRGAPEYDLINSAEDRESVARIMAAEAEAALLSSSDALGWYDTTLKLAKQTLFPVYPEVSPTRPDGTDNPLYDSASEHAFDYATAVTSNGLSVIDNYLLAARQYDAWKNNPDGKFDLTASGAQGKSMIKAWEFWNALTDLGYDSNQINELLTTQLPKGELASLMTEVFGVDRVKDLPFKIDGKEQADQMVGVAYVIGPKIGNGFYQNLRGNFDPLTMDRWWMRFVNRITGKPIVQYSEELVKKNKDTLWNLVSNPEQLSEMDQDLLATVLDDLGVTTLEKSDIELLAPQIMSTWDKSFYNKAYNDKLNDLSDQYDFNISGATITGKDAATVKKIAQDARPDSTPLAKAGKNLANKLVESLQEDPRSAADRAAMRATANRAREILKQSNQLGVDISNADFQALMWYAEKRIFAAGGVRKGRGDDNDYADGAIAILKKKGISDGKIEATLPEAERGRLSGVKLELERDSEIGREIDTIQETTGERNFFSPRELKLEDYSQSVQGQITPEERAELNSVETNPQLPPQRYPSRFAVFDPEVEPTAEDYRKSYMLERVPVKKSDRGQTPSPVYGKILEGKTERLVVLPTGLQNNHANGIQDGHGLVHIQQRNHDKDLFMNSKYGRVEEAIRDLMERWRRQGFQDGEDVISYQNQNKLVLEWRKNITNGSPPLRLVLERGSDVSTRGKQVSTLQPNFYYVKTFFPILEKKARKTVANTHSYRQSTMLSSLPVQIEEKKYDLSYAKASDFIARKLGYFIPQSKSQDIADKIINQFQDDFISVGRMYQELQENDVEIPDAFDAYLAEELYHGKVPEELRARQDLYAAPVDAIKELNISQDSIDRLEGLSDAASETGNGFVKQALSSYGSKKQAVGDAVIYATHAKERNAFIRTRDPSNDSGSGMSDAEADAILAWVATLDPDNALKLQRMQSGIRDIIKNTNDSRADYGLIPEDLRQDRNFNNYVPLRGKEDPTDNDMSFVRPRSGSPFGVRGREDRRALGRYDYATDILATVLDQNQNAVIRGERNKVGQAFIGLLESKPNETRGYGRVLDSVPTTRALSSSGNVVEIVDRFAADSDNIFVAKVNGKDVYVELADKRLGRALKGSDGTGSSTLATINRAMGKLNRYLSNINTSYNPEFMITNLVRDLQTAGVNVQQFDAKGMVGAMAKDYRKAFVGIKRAIVNGDESSEWSQIYRDFVRDGGQNSANPMTSIADQVENINKILGDIQEDGIRGKFNKVKNSFVGKGAGSILNFLENYNTVIENAIRVTTYHNLKKQGFSGARAAQAARNVTVNFGKGGELKTFMNSWYLFYNASIQGSFALFNALLRSKKVQAIWIGLIGMGALQDFVNSLVSEEDEDGILIYDKIPDYILEHNMVLPLGDLGAGRDYLAIPMPYGLNAAVNAGRALSRTMRGEYSASEGGLSMVMTAVDALNPIGGTENLYNFAVPTAFDPFVEIMRNENYAGVPVYKQAYPGDDSPDSQRYFNNVSPSAKWVAENLNSLTGGTSEISGFVDWNPEIMDYWFDFLTGGIGRFAKRTFVDVPTTAYAEGLSQDLAREVPFVRKVYGTVSDRENIGIFVEKRDKVLRVAAEIKAAQDAGDRDRLLRAREKYAEEFTLIPRVRAINNAIKKISRQQNIVRDNVNMPDAQKQLILDRLDEKKQMLYARGNEIMKDYR